MSKNKKYNLFKEYTGTGAGGGNAGDGNNITSQRSRFDDPWGEDEMEFYLNQNKGEGGNGGHYTGDSATFAHNKSHYSGIMELEKYIKQVLEEMEEEIEEQAYGSATLTTQGQRKKRYAPIYNAPPGMWMEKINEQQQDPRVRDIQDRVVRRNIDNMEDQLEIQRIGVQNQSAQMGAQSAQQAVQLGNLENQLSDLANQKSQIILFIKQAAAEFAQNFPADIIDYTPEDIERKEALAAEVEDWREQIKGIEEKQKEIAKSKSKSISAAASSKSQAQRGISMARKQFRTQKKAMKKQIAQMQRMSEDYFSSRKDKNLMEYMDSYKREILLEKTISKFFKEFDNGRTDEELIKLYAEQGVIVPDTFVKKIRSKHESLKRDKLDLEELETETKNFKKVPVIDEDETEIEVKELSSRLFKEGKVKRRYNIPVEITNTLENELNMYPLMRFIKNAKAVNSTIPTYRFFLLNGNFFDIKYEEIRPGEYGLMAKMGIDEYDLYNYKDKNYAKKHIDRLMTEPILQKQEDEDDLGDLELPTSTKKSSAKPKDTDPPKMTGVVPPDVPPLPPPPPPTPEV